MAKRINHTKRQVPQIIRAVAITALLTMTSIMSAHAAPDNLINDALSALRGIVESQRDLNPEQEYNLGRATAARVIGKKSLATDKSLYQVTLLVQAMAKITDAPPTLTGYHAAVISDDYSLNAFALPGGYILITRGLYDLCTGDELLAVLAHELAHLKLKHGVNSIKNAKLTSALTSAAATTLSTTEIAKLVAESAASLTDTLVVKGYSRNTELEADAEALKILKLTGVSPTAFDSILEKIGQNATKNDAAGGFFSTHPSTEDRRNNLGQLLASIEPTRQ